MPTTTHTPTPWRVTGKTVRAQDFSVADCVIDCEKGSASANAQHIVHCVNTHAALVAALKDLLRCVKTDGQAHPDEHTYYLEGHVGPAIKQAIHALAQERSAS